MQLAGTIASVLLPLLIYLAPTFFAAWRKHPGLPKILILNVFLGWTLIGWAAALALAMNVNPNPPKGRQGG